MISFETGVRVERPIEDVFDYVSEPTNLPRWNSAVRTVRSSSGGNGSGRTFVMERHLPGGAAVNVLEVVSRDRPRELVLRTTSGPTPFRYRYRFARDSGGTIIELHADVELTGLLTLLGPVAQRVVRGGVDDNLAALKTILEAPAGG